MQVGVNEIHGLASVEGVSVLVNDLLEEIGHLVTVRAELLLYGTDPGNVAVDWHVVYVIQLSKQLEAFVNEARKTGKSRLMPFESNAHDSCENDIRNRQANVVG